MFGTVTKITEYNTGLPFLAILGTILIIISVITMILSPMIVDTDLWLVIVVAVSLVFTGAGIFMISKGVDENNAKIRQYQDEISQAYQDSYKNIEKAIHDNFSEVEMLSDISESGSFKYKDDFYKYKVEDNTLYIECYSGDSSKNKVISGKDY